MTLDEIVNSPEYLRGQTLKYLQRRKAGDLERAKYFCGEADRTWAAGRGRQAPPSHRPLGPPSPDSRALRFPKNQQDHRPDPNPAHDVSDLNFHISPP